MALLSGQEIKTGWELVDLAVKAKRVLQKLGARGLVRKFNERSFLGYATNFHTEVLHGLRSLVINNTAISDSATTYDRLTDLANAQRNLVADLLAIDHQRIHCTIKVCLGDSATRKEDWKVFTIARSVPCDRPAEFGGRYYHLVGQNSGFASIVGSTDTHNTWAPYTYPCFACNDLKVFLDRYACSRTDWHRYYCATTVFPLRFRKAGQPSCTVFGFLTFDSLVPGVFGKIPDTFGFVGNKDGYHQGLSTSAMYHLGGMLADTLAIAFFQLLPQIKMEATS